MAETLRTIPETAAQLRSSRASVYRLIKNGDLPSITLGRARRIPASAIDRLIADKLAEAKAS